MTNIQLLYQLDECLDWIIDNKFTRIALQLKHEDLKYSVDIMRYLNSETGRRLDQSDTREPLNLYIAKTNTCCVDLLVTQHVKSLDAIIHFGKVCLSKPELENQDCQLPTLFVFGRSLSLDQEQLIEATNRIITNLKSIKESDNLKRIFVAYDTDLIDCANKLRDRLQDDDLRECVFVARLNNLSSSWYTTAENEPYFQRYEGSKENLIDHYILDHTAESYDCAIYLGTRNSINLTLNGPSKQFRIDPRVGADLETINVTRVLNRRMALVGRLKEENELNVGVILTNPLPNIGRVSANLENYAKSRKHRLYYISMIQTIDECKIGNFDLCDAFVVINSCTCSTILESLVFNRPIIAEHEFKLACGIEAEYGRVLWPGSSSHLSADDMINKRKVSDVSLALIHTRNELLERCSQARTNKWSGMEYKASAGIDGGDGLKESLEVVEGLHGIASSYASEPLRKSSTNSPPQEEKSSCSSSSVDNVNASSNCRNAMLCSSQGADSGVCSCDVGNSSSGSRSNNNDNSKG